MTALDPERQRVMEAVRAAEARTRAEFAAVVALRADPYLLPPFLVAVCATLLLHGVLLLTTPELPGVSLYFLHVFVLAGLAWVLRSPVILPHLVPRSVREACARRLARESFYRVGLHRTRERSGVLLFISLTERHVEIIADEAIHAAVPAGSWDKIVQTFTDAVRKKDAVDGLVAALAALGDVLGTALPRRDDDSNEIPDRLIEI